jgi:hypothetical protein
MVSTGGRAPPSQNKQRPCAISHWPAEARGSPAPGLSAWRRHQSERPARGRCRDRPSSPTQAAYEPNSRSLRRSTKPPPSAMHARLNDPKPSAPHGREPRWKICSSYCSSWLHLLRSWSLRRFSFPSSTSAAHSTRPPSLNHKRFIRCGALLVRLCFSMDSIMVGAHLGRGAPRAQRCGQAANLVTVEEGDHAIVEEIGCRDRCLAIISLAQATLA